MYPAKATTNQDKHQMKMPPLSKPQDKHPMKTQPLNKPQRNHQRIKLPTSSANTEPSMGLVAERSAMKQDTTLSSVQSEDTELDDNYLVETIVKLLREQGCLVEKEQMVPHWNRTKPDGTTEEARLDLRVRHEIGTCTSTLPLPTF